MDWQNVATYVYDETNRMVEGKNEQGEYSLYTYNGLGVRVARELIMLDNTHGYTDFHKETPSVDAGITKAEVAKESYVIDYTSATFNPLTMDEVGGFNYRYVYGLDKLSVKITSEGTNWWGQHVTDDILKDYYHQDRLGSTTNLTDKFGRVVGRADYNEWGQITYKDALDITSSYRRIYPQLNYTGHDWDDVLGMYYAKARFYSADDKRFVAMDPIKGQITNPLSMVSYLYCVDNPLRWVDPLGLMAIDRNPAYTYLDGDGGGSSGNEEDKTKSSSDLKSVKDLPIKKSAQENKLDQIDKVNKFNQTTNKTVNKTTQKADTTKQFVQDTSSQKDTNKVDKLNTLSPTTNTTPGTEAPVAQVNSLVHTSEQNQARAQELSRLRPADGPEFAYDILDNIDGGGQGGGGIIVPIDPLKIIKVLFALVAAPFIYVGGRLVTTPQYNRDALTPQLETQDKFGCPGVANQDADELPVPVVPDVAGASTPGDPNHNDDDGDDDSNKDKTADSYEEAKRTGKKAPNHEPHHEGNRSLPTEGKPNSSADLNRDGKLVQRRYYGPTGQAELDIDYSHSGPGHVFPHRHPWIDGVRQ